MTIDAPNHERLAGSRQRILAAALLLFLTLFTNPVLMAQTIRQREFVPLSPRIMAQGRSHVATARGYESLFTNPAGIAWTEEPELTLPSLTLWAHSRPDLLLSTIGALGADETLDEQEGDPVLDILKEQFTTNGFGMGAALGIGYVGQGIGVGFNVATDSYLYGETFPLGLEGEVHQQMMLTIGYGRPFEVGPVALALGGTLRPIIRISSIVDSEAAADLVSEFFGVDAEEDGEGGGDPLDTLTALNGYGVAFDAGIMARYESFTLGVQARNLLNTNMEYARHSLGDVADAIASGGLPSRPGDRSDPSYVSEKYVIPVEYSFGLAWQPHLGDLAVILDPKLHFQVTDPFKLTDPDRNRPRSFWTRLHLGSEVRILNFFDYRLGLNQGYLTTGFGVDMAFFNISFAIYSQEYGRYPGDQQVGGASLEFAFRF